MHWPQITMIVLMAVAWTGAAIKHGEARPPYSIGWASLGTALSTGLLYAGGFFGT